MNKDESNSPRESSNENAVTAKNFGGMAKLSGAIAVFALGCFLGMWGGKKYSADVSGLSARIDGVQSNLEAVVDKQVGGIRSEIETLKASVDGIRQIGSNAGTHTAGDGFAIEKARELEKAGDHGKAGYYWRHAVEHADDESLLTVLKEYAETVFKSGTADESRYAEAATLEHLAQLALVRIPPKKMDEALAFRDKCAKFHSALFEASSQLAEDEPSEPEEQDSSPEMAVRTVANSVEKLLSELENEVKGYNPYAGYNPHSVPDWVRDGNSKGRSESGCDGLATETECRILQLSGVVETAMSQIWFLDRTGLDDETAKRIRSFPKRLADAIGEFDEKHDKPLLKDIRILVQATPPKAESAAPHQCNIVFYTNQCEKVSFLARQLRGTEARAKAQESMSEIMKKVADEKRQQMNEYQKFVANCCKLAFDAFDPIMNATAAGYGRIPKKKGYKSPDDFIMRYVRSFAANVPLATLSRETNFLKVYADDNLVSLALERKAGGLDYHNIENERKAFIATAVFGFYRVDQSLLTPETSRMFNDVLGKYYKKMKPAQKALSVRWMVEESKIYLEDF